jgi:hypothetical protein
MLFKRLSLEDNAPKSSKRKPIHEVISFPRFEPTSGSDSCQNPSLECEHLLSCGHIILTPKPNEPCAPNCYHVSAKKERQKGTKDDKHFYCDACVETENETKIPSRATCTEAGKKPSAYPNDRQMLM